MLINFFSKNNKFLKVIFVIIFISLIFSSLVTAQDFNEITISAGSIGGPLYLYSIAFAQVCNKVLPEINVSIMVGGGSVDNAVRLHRGLVNISPIQVNDVEDIYLERGNYEKPIHKGFIFFPAQQNQFHLIVRADSDIYSLEDLNSKNISIQPTGASTHWAMLAIFEALDIKYNSYNYTHATASDALLSRDIDAHAAGGPNPTFMALAARLPLRVLSFTDDQLEVLYQKLGYILPSTFEGGKYYPGAETVKTPFAWQMFTAREDVPKEIIYTLTKALWENKETLVNAFEAAKNLEPKQILDGGSNIPIHPGAIQYYEEIGIEIPESARP